MIDRRPDDIVRCADVMTAVNLRVTERRYRNRNGDGYNDAGLEIRAPASAELD